MGEGDEMFSVVLDRQGQFQTELFILPPLASTSIMQREDGVQKVRRHLHPGIDSIELAVCGEFLFSVGDKSIQMETTGQRIGDNISTEVPENAAHGAEADGDGLSFLSFQYWKNQSPTSVGQIFEEEKE